MKTVKPSKNAGQIPALTKKKSQGLRFKSNAAAENEAAKLRANRERLDFEPSTGDNDARASLL
jgi:hypothetical protein